MAVIGVATREGGAERRARVVASVSRVCVCASFARARRSGCHVVGPYDLLAGDASTGWLASDETRPRNETGHQIIDLVLFRHGG